MLVEDNGENNTVIGEIKNPNLKIVFNGNNNKIRIGENVNLAGEIVFPNHDAKVNIKDNSRGRLQVYLRGQASRFVLGSNVNINSRLWASMAETGNELRIGDGCLIASAVCRTSDSHPIYDLETGERINESANIDIKDGVWLGQESMILKGVTIGSGAIIGARALVTGNIPPNSLAIGAPAKVVRSSVSWRVDP